MDEDRLYDTKTKSLTPEAGKLAKKMFIKVHPKLGNQVEQRNQLLQDINNNKKVKKHFGNRVKSHVKNRSVYNIDRRTGDIDINTTALRDRGAESQAERNIENASSKLKELVPKIERNAQYSRSANSIMQRAPKK